MLDITDLADDVRTRIKDSSISPETSASATSHIEALETDLEVATNGQAQKNHLVDKLAEEKARYQANDASDLPAWVDDRTVRSDPLCDCANRCAVMQARLPPQVRNADGDLDEEIRLYTMSHPGHPQALHACWRAVRDLRAHVRTRLVTILGALEADLPVDEYETLADDGAEDGDAAADEDERARETSSAAD